MSYDHIQLDSSPWIIYIDKKSSKLYYYHPETKKTVWEEPKELTKWKVAAIDLFLKSTSWRRATHDDGRVYYYDKTTKKSQWHAPNEVTQFETYLQTYTQNQLKSRKSSSSSQQPSQTAAATSSSSFANVKPESKVVEAKTQLQEVKKAQEAAEVEEEEEESVADSERTPEQDYDEDSDDDEHLYGDNVLIDTHDYTYSETEQSHGAILERYNSMETVSHDSSANNNIAESAEKKEAEIKSLVSILSKRDSIIEPNVVPNTKRLRLLTNEDPMTTIKRLSDNYIGFAPMANIATEWLIVAKLLNHQPSLFKPNANPDILHEFLKQREEEKKEIGNLIMNELANMIKHKFDRNAADAIILKVSDIPAWLLAMMKNDILRKTLIELYNMHTDSTLLGFVLRQLSRLGYQHEIAHIIREFEYLEVFEDIMIDLMKRVSSMILCDL
jgi:hypothetical protein